MTTPAGWYDDGSGRQRWWDGTQWTEHFAPVAEPETAPTSSTESADASAPADEQPTEDVPSAASETVAAAAPTAPEVPPIPELPSTAEQQATDAWAPAQPAEQQASQFAAPGDTAATAPLNEGLPPYAAPAPAPGYEAAPGYTGEPSAQTYPAAPGYQAPAPGYAAAGVGQAPYGVAPAAPASISILGLVGLGLAALGTILSCIPVTFIFGWILLFAGFVVSIISLFLKGKKWPGIAGLILSVVGTIVAIVMAIVFAAMALNSAIDDLPSSYPTSSTEETPSDEPSDAAEDPDAALGRPTVDELKVGLRAVIEESTGSGDSYTDAQVTCFAEAFVASDVDDATLRKIAEGTGVFEDVNAASAFAEVFGDNISTCMLAQ
jgi:hypothetical protein